MSKNQLILIGIIGTILYFFLEDISKDKTYLFCETTTAHHKIMEGKKVENNIPSKFVLYLDKPFDVLIFPMVGFQNEKKMQDYKVFKENIENEDFIFHLSTEGQQNDSYTLSPARKKEKFPYKVLFLSASTLNIRYIDREKFSGRSHTVIANCRTWAMSMGKGGKDQI